MPSHSQSWHRDSLHRFKLDSYGLKFWQYHAERLKRVRVLSELDLYALAAAAQWWSVYQRAMEGLSDKLTQVTPANGEVAKSEVAIAKQAFSQCWAIMSAFGLNPGDRAKLRALPPDPEDDPAEEFFARRFLA
jgi:P27 family predicted phage terminase small subunit